MTVKKLETLADLITEAERRYDRWSEESGFRADYYLGRLRGLQDAAKCARLTPAEQAVIDAALALGPLPDIVAPRLAKALNMLRKEREIKEQK